MHRIAIISPDASEGIRKNLMGLDLEPVPVPKTTLVARPISGHPDLQVFVHDGRVFCHPDISRSFISSIEKNAEVIVCGTRLAGDHPGDIPYNIACAGGRAFHHRTVIDPTVREYLDAQHITRTAVRQGYAKCSAMIVDDGAIVTSDVSIHGAAAASGIASLLIRPGSIELPGYRYGFIGGATGTLEDAVLCTGGLEHHPDYENISAFIAGRGKKIVPLDRGPAIDLGTIFII